jgi:toxin YoeB
MEVIYRLIFFKDAIKDINYWKKSGNKQAINKIDKILEVLEYNPHSSTPGEPEMLKYTTGYSRRITKKDRITYDINEVAKEVIIFRMRGHYGDK